MSVQNNTEASGTTEAATSETSTATTHAPHVVEAAALAGVTLDPVTEEPTAPAGEPAGTSEQDEQQDHVLERFRLEDVPEEYREHVERYVKQAQGDYTRKTQGTAAERREAEALRAEAQAALDLQAQLMNPESRDEVLRQLVRDAGWEIDEPPEEYGALPDEADQFRDPRVDRLLADQEHQRAADAERQAQQAAEQHRAEIVGHVETQLAAYATASGETNGLPESARRMIITAAASLPLTADGLPDMQAAITQYEADRAAEVQRYVASKDVPSPDASGSSGQPTFDSRNPKERIAAAERVAERAYARHR